MLFREPHRCDVAFLLGWAGGDSGLAGGGGGEVGGLDFIAAVGSVAAFSRLLGAVHAHIGFDAEQFRLVGVLGEGGYSYAGADDYKLIVEEHGHGEDFFEIFGDRGSGFAGVCFFEDDAELIAAGSGDGV